MILLADYLLGLGLSTPKKNYISNSSELGPIFARDETRTHIAENYY